MIDLMTDRSATGGSPAAASATAPDAASRRSAGALRSLDAEIVACRACPRLVAWREEVARTRVARFATETYWGRPIPGFGDADARILVLGLAPAAHGGNRTGRVFTGDRSGDVLYAALHRAGLARIATSTSRDDGQALTGCRVTAAVRCAPPGNHPTTRERDTCAPYLVREVAALADLRVTVALGAFAWDAALRTLAALGSPSRPRPRFGHGAEARVGPVLLLGCYHPSQQNTFTGRLTPAMVDDVLARAVAAAAWDDAGPLDTERAG
jgi:uracil-DNA glycosylase family 4